MAMIPAVYFHSSSFNGLGAYVYEGCEPDDYGNVPAHCLETPSGNSSAMNELLNWLENVGGTYPTTGSNVITVIDPKTGKQYVPPSPLQSMLPILAFGGGALLLLLVMKRA